MLAQTRYAPADGGAIAYQRFGDGPIEVVIANGFPGHVELGWEQPGMARLLRRLATFATVTAFDRRGVGLSDPSPPDDTPASRAEDLVCLLDHVGADRASFVTFGEGGFGALHLAATRPERVESLVLNAAYPRLTRGVDYAYGISPAEVEQMAALAEQDWGTGSWMIRTLFPDHADDPLFRQRMARLERYTATPSRAAAIWRRVATFDARPLLPHITARTLVVTGPSNPAHGPGHAGHFVEHMPAARSLVLPAGRVVGTFFDAEPAEGDEIQEFLTGTRADPTAGREIAAILFTDIVGSTAAVAKAGDRRWRDVLDHHDAVSADHVSRFGGRVVKTTGDGVLAVFPSASRAVICAFAARDDLAAVGIATRAGVHVGEVELRGEDVAGLAVHIAQRVSSEAGAGEVVVSQTAADLLADAAVHLTDLGPHHLKGLDRPWTILAASPAPPV